VDGNKAEDKSVGLVVESASKWAGAPADGWASKQAGGLADGSAGEPADEWADASTWVVSSRSHRLQRYLLCQRHRRKPGRRLQSTTRLS